MFNKTKIALSIAMVLGAASGALASNEHDSDGYGGYVISGSTDGVNPVYHQDIFGSARKAYGYAVLPSQKHRPPLDRR
jgi:hypothetical protein